MEKLTITKATEDKTIKTKFGDKLKQGVQFAEYPDLWHDLWGGGKKVSDVVEGTRESRDYEGKTYWTFKLPKKNDYDQSKSIEMLSQLLTKVGLINAKIDYLAEKLYPREKAVAESYTDYPKEDIKAEDVGF